MKSYKNKRLLKKKYKELGSTRKVGKFFGVTNTTICHWMSKFGLPRNPRLDIQDNNSGSGRRGELYIKKHPFFNGKNIDLGEFDDKAKRDFIWDSNPIDVKTSHWKRPIFRIKTKRHKCRYYICLYYIDKTSKYVPVEIWIIPSRIAPHSNISPGFRKKSKFDKYRLSMQRGKIFNAEKESQYNKAFEKYYKNIFKKNKKI